MKNTDNIAVVGLDLRYPGANNKEEFWNLILGRRKQFRNIPKNRLNLELYGGDESELDATYVKKAALLNNYEFDRIKYKVSKSTFEQTDMAQWMALDVAYGALKDAGFENGNGLDKNRVGVIIGNSLNGEFTRANVMRLRWPYVNKVFVNTMETLGYKEHEIQEILDELEVNYKRPFPVPNADTLAGGLSNTIAGRICNYFDFKGGGFTVDGACSSSLLAITQGCESILTDRLQVALVGGVDLSIDPFELVGFARNGALAKEDMQVYGENSQGFWPGEGCGVIVLMKESEALAKKIPIYSIIKGWGISSDGKGGVTRPKPETQQLALKRAYEMAGYSASTVGYFEGHGTGTKIGDEVELTALVNQLKNDQLVKSSVGSVKNLIGHTKAAAGIAGLIKASLILKKGIVPGTPSIKGEHKIIRENKGVLELPKKAFLWSKNDSFKAGVSSFGFGGINVHVTMEQSNIDKLKKSRFTKKEEALIQSNPENEFILICEKDISDFISKIKVLKNLANKISFDELKDLSKSLYQKLNSKLSVKCCLLVKSPDDLLLKLNRIEQVIDDNKTEYFNSRLGIFYTTENAPDRKIVFLFPGQGSKMYSHINEKWNFFTSLIHPKNTILDITNGQENKWTSDLIQSSIVARTLESIEILESLGIKADYAIGHSLGEICALAWSGAYTHKNAINIAKCRGTAIENEGIKGGGLAVINCTEKQLNSLIKTTDIKITGYNSNNNYTIGGKIEDLEKMKSQAHAMGIVCVILDVTHAFHTNDMERASEVFYNKIKNKEFNGIHKCIISTVTGKELDSKTDLPKYLRQQILKPVNFEAAIKFLSNQNIAFVEVGPGNSLQTLLKMHRASPSISVDYGADKPNGLFQAMALSFVLGQEVNFEDYFYTKSTKDFNIDNWELKTLSNPCDADGASKILKTKNSIDVPFIKENTASHIESKHLESKEFYIRDLIADKLEIPIEVVSLTNKFMSDLHLNSLVIAEIISTIIKKYGRSQKTFSKLSIMATADCSLLELVNELEKDIEEKTTYVGSKVDFEQVHNWTHIFSKKLIPAKLANLSVEFEEGRIVYDGNSQMYTEFERYVTKKFKKLPSSAIYFYNTLKTDKVLSEFLEFLKKVQDLDVENVILVGATKINYDYSLKPVFKSFALEYPDLNCLSLEFATGVPEISEYIIKEIHLLKGFQEVYYDEFLSRHWYRFSPYFPSKHIVTNFINENDVILISGGGKGITFECASLLGAKYGCKLVLLGTSQIVPSTELSDNLESLHKKSIPFVYVPVDITDATKVAVAIKNLPEDFKKISGIVHGAGINKPKRFDTLTLKDFRNTSKVKIDGLNNILSAISVNSLKLLTGFGSIIGESGMQGNADYANANAELKQLISAFSKQNPNCKCLTFQWSVWDGTGMGKNLKSIDSLKQIGVWPIPIENGLSVFDELINDNKILNDSFVITGRYGEIPTIKFSESNKVIRRFVDYSGYYFPNIEIISDIKISLDNDPYLKHHVFGNQYVFPTVMILEGATQLVECLSSNSKCITFNDLIINRSIFVPLKKENIIRFVVTRIRKDYFKVIVRSEDSDFEVNCFEFSINTAEFPVDKSLISNPMVNSKLSIDVQKEFYDDLLFHTGPFRTIKAFNYLNSKVSKAEVGFQNNPFQWFGPFLPQHLNLGNPGVNDATIHCHQSTRPAEQLLPTSAGIIKFDFRHHTEIKSIETEEVGFTDESTIINVFAKNENGTVIQEWRDLTLTKVNGYDRTLQWTPPFLKAFLEFELRKRGLGDIDIELKRLEELFEMVKKYKEGIIELKENNLHISITNTKEALSESVCSFKISIDKTMESFVLNINHLNTVITL